MPLQAILTKHLGPTNTKGARIVATIGSGISLTRAYDHELSDDDNHRATAEALRDKLGWRGRLIAGGTKDGCAFVFADDSAEVE